MEPYFDVFLKDGNSLEFIIGIDRDGTDRVALRKLLALENAHHGQVTTWIFQAPHRESIFHPKLYLYKYGRKLDAVVGSANFTRSGMSTNLESLLKFENIGISSRTSKEILSIWNRFADPQTPLKPTFCKRLDDALMARIKDRIPKKSSDIPRTGKKDEWSPRSAIKLVGKKTPTQRKPVVGVRDFLLIDVMRETRKTQMQLPLHVVESFFKVDRYSHATIELSCVSSEGLTQPIDRYIVLSGGKSQGRLMRRIEMPPIRNLERSLVAIFLRLPGKRSFAYKLLPRNSAEWKLVNSILEKSGQQGNAKRRYYIGKYNDGIWKNINTFFPTKVPSDA